MNNIPSFDEVGQFLFHDEKSGEVRWKVKRKNGNPGTRAGRIDSYGYLVVGLGNKQYKAHRIAWLLNFGEWPNQAIDHIDGDKTNNRISNLRLANPSENMFNHKVSRANKSGVKGVCWNKRAKKWKASLRIGRGERLHIGYFNEISVASIALNKEREKYHGEYANNG